MKRVIYTFATGHDRYKAMARSLGQSLILQGSKTHRLLMTDLPAHPSLQDVWDEIIGPDERFPHWYSKFAVLTLTDADAVMFVDGDSLAVRNPDALFDQLQGTPFAVQGEWRAEDVWYGDFKAARKYVGVDKAPIFNGGWMYYERGPETERLIEEVLRLYREYNKLGTDLLYGKAPEEVTLSLAIAKTGIGKVLPPTADISSTPNYLVGRAHLDVLKGECTMIEGRYAPVVCKPIFYHSAMVRYDIRYWYQAWRTRKALEKYKGWPRPKDTLPVKLWRRVVWAWTIFFVWITKLQKFD